ncbi:MAG: alpha-mannosidase [Acidimicrobiales bacterium]
MTSRRVAIVPHTHWDREWYASFQSFRLRLVDTLDALLPLMESDPSYARFLLDGQVAALDDYLEVRPTAAARVRALAAAGRLTVGPWYALMDEFLVSAETIVRNLQLGMRRASAFGGAMPIGYLPDMFGHVAQMPQILGLAGFEHAVVWRGVPSAITKTGFTWVSPDGSSVRAEYLPFGYGNGALLPDDAKDLVRRVVDHVEQIGPFLLDALLFMNGSDHLPPQPGLGRIVAEANDLQDDFDFEITSLPEYLDELGTDGLERWEGELRSGVRANMLMGVTSNRVDVKRAAAATERMLERRAEPYAALFLGREHWPARLLELAWIQVVRNSAHDSICACSADPVVDAVLHRFSEARDIAEGVAVRALASLSASMASPGPLVVNPSQRTRGGIVELVVRDDMADGAGRAQVQVVTERAALPDMLVLDSQTVRTILATMESAKLDDEAWVQEVRIDEDDAGIDVTVSIGPDERPDLPLAAAKQDLMSRLGARTDARVRLHLEQPAIRRILARVDGVPGFGWQAFSPVDAAHPVTVDERPAEVALSNGLVSVVVDRTDGTFAVDGIAGMGRIEDGGDLGDSYNYSPPAADSVVDTPSSVTVEICEQGPLRARAVITASFTWAEHVDDGTQGRVGERRVEIATTIEVRADERAVRVSTIFVNPSRDHRVRVLFPLPRVATGSVAECAFGVVSRGLSAEGRPEERGLATFPARRFVRAGGLTVVHDGVTEYELVGITGGDDSVEDDRGRAADTLALTVLRSTGMLSRLGMAYRPFPAGPLTPVDGLQMVGRSVELRYAVVVGDVDPWALADDVLLPLEAVTSVGGGALAASGSALEVTGAEVSAVHRQGGQLEVRVFNPGDEPCHVDFGGSSGWLVDLRGAPISPFDGAFELRGHGIATVRLQGD